MGAEGGGEEERGGDGEAGGGEREEGAVSLLVGGCPHPFIIFHNINVYMLLLPCFPYELSQ